MKINILTMRDAIDIYPLHVDDDEFQNFKKRGSVRHELFPFIDIIDAQVSYFVVPGYTPQEEQENNNPQGVNRFCIKRMPLNHEVMYTCRE